ncbi:hypothetical protein [Acidocella sp.]|nr:hypothetical protein [Acidocella sp.]
MLRELQGELPDFRDGPSNLFLGVMALAQWRTAVIMAHMPYNGLI